jgi:hypothetical protein
MISAIVRIVTSISGALLAFAGWLVLLLSSMPRPPVPPSCPVTLTGAAAVAVGFVVGMLVGERITRCRSSKPWSLLLWCVMSCATGATLLFPFGGMLAGFGILGLGATAVVVWEARRC